MGDTIDVPEGRNLDVDLEALADAFFQNLYREQHTEYGGWGLDDKRPFGNSSVELDILEIIGMSPDDFADAEHSILPEYRTYANNLYEELGPYLTAKWFERKTNTTK